MSKLVFKLHPSIWLDAFAIYLSLGAVEKKVILQALTTQFLLQKPFQLPKSTIDSFLK